MFSQSTLRCLPSSENSRVGQEKWGLCCRKQIGLKTSPGSDPNSPLLGLLDPGKDTRPLPPAAAHIRECQDGGVGRAAEGCSWGLGGKGGKWSVLLSPQVSPQSKERGWLQFKRW